MVRRMCGVKVKDRIPSKELRERLGLDDIISVLQKKRSRLYGYVLWKEDNDWVKWCMGYEVECARPRDRPKKTWTEIVQKDCQAHKLNSKDAMDHSRWRKQIIDDWWLGSVWVDECFIWYRLTQLVPDKIQRAVKWLCVCVCVWLTLLTSLGHLLRWPNKPGKNVRPSIRMYVRTYTYVCTSVRPYVHNQTQCSHKPNSGIC